MTIAIAIAAIVVVAAVGVWLLRRQTALSRDRGPVRTIEDGPPAGGDETEPAGPAAEVPWSRAGGAPGDASGDASGVPRTVVEEPISSAAPEALDALEVLESEGSPRPAERRASGSTRADTPDSDPERPE
jgi:hypothetical protein